jgi:hypothetical protein
MPGHVAISAHGPRAGTIEAYAKAHVGAETAGPGQRGSFVEHAAADAAPEVLGRAPEELAVNHADRPVGQHVDSATGRSFPTIRLLPRGLR